MTPKQGQRVSRMVRCSTARVNVTVVPTVARLYPADVRKIKRLDLQRWHIRCFRRQSLIAKNQRERTEQAELLGARPFAPQRLLGAHIKNVVRFIRDESLLANLRRRCTTGGRRETAFGVDTVDVSGVDHDVAARRAFLRGGDLQE